MAIALLQKLRDNRQNRDLGIRLKQLIFAADLIVKKLPQDKERATENKTGQHTQQRIA